VLKIKGKIVQSTEIGIKSIKNNILYVQYHSTVQLVVFTMIYARKIHKDRIKVFVSSLPSHYLHWTRNMTKGQCLLLSFVKKTMYFAVVGKKTKFFNVVGKKVNAFFPVVGKKTKCLLALEKRQCFLLSLEKKQWFFCHWKRIQCFLANIGKENNVFAVIGKEDNAFCCRCKRILWRLSYSVLLICLLLRSISVARVYM
jgi:hypothetical protein